MYCFKRVNSLSEHIYYCFTPTLNAKSWKMKVILSIISPQDDSYLEYKASFTGDCKPNQYCSSESPELLDQN